MTTAVQQKGTTLVEVLIAVLLLAIGLLGFASAQSQALRLSSDALQYSRASWMADDWFGRMRANPVQALNHNGYLFDTSNNTPSAPDCARHDCSPDRIADHDLSLWLQQLDDILPGATAANQRDGRQFQLTIRLAASVEGVRPEFVFVTRL
ncbi:type IV pilus modification protein PilV [Saccharospirillum sp. MSK14-1]|uniref:type IV pilus modification protein PilV n=1 Tax=Saccharospirillum sp. MSK14-1 TaxID=1897632 RepID=UPI000D3D056A|nr:type IV pilus modification protein PilV [Saccharospirillum sp. MSK14-1]PTY38122.1 type IV pilus modification protein PilV [Saccharospirillum sp. MSK14-1]